MFLGGQSTTVVQSEISQQLFDGLPNKLVVVSTDIYGPCRMNPSDFGDDMKHFSSVIMRLTFVIFFFVKYCDSWMDWREIWCSHLCFHRDVLE